MKSLLIHIVQLLLQSSPSLKFKKLDPYQMYIYLNNIKFIPIEDLQKLYVILIQERDALNKRVMKAFDEIKNDF